MRRERGVSVVETIVVVVCVVLCLLVAVPIQGQKRMTAEDLDCMVNLHQWGEIFQYYNDRSGGWFITPDEPYYWIWELNETHKDRNKTKMWLCPRAEKPVCDANGTRVGDAGTFGAWGVLTGDEFGPTGMAGSYGLNGYALDTRPEKIFGAIDMANNWRKLDVKGAANIPLFLDAMRFDLWPLHTDPPPAEKEHDWIKNQMGRACIDRHNGAVNCLFMNQSVRKVGLKELWTLKWHRQFNTAGPWTKAGGVQPEDWPQWMRGYRDY